MAKQREFKQIRTAKADDIPTTVIRIFSYMGRYRVALIFVFICILISSLTNVASSYFFTPIINDYIVPFIGEENPDLSNFRNMLFVLAGIYGAGVITSYVWRKLLSLISSGMLRDVRNDLFQKMQNMSIRFYDTHTHGDLMNFYTNDVDTMRPLIQETFPTAVSTLINVIGVIIMMTTLNVKLMIVCVIGLVFMFMITFLLGKKGRKHFKGIQKHSSEINGYCEELFQGQKVVKVFNHEKEAYEGFMVYNMAMYKDAVMTNTFAGMLMPINGNLAYMLYALVAVLGAKMTITGELSLGALASFLLYTRQIAGPISNLSQQFNGMMMAIAGAERVFRIIDTEPEIDEGEYELVSVKMNDDSSIVETEEETGMYGWKNAKNHDLVLLKGDIRLHHVTFGYDENKVVLNDVSLYAKPGQKIAFVGSTGAGKTTITNLINRFYDVDEGSITYDGIDIKKIKKASLRKSLGCVLQDTNLFTGTVLDNIRYGNLQATDEQCIAAAKLANAHSFIKRLPEGYHTMLTANGANLSQGQRQLLNIARAAVANPPVLILDEATSSIDTHTEKLIEKGMDQLMNGRTVFVIAHRLSTVRNSNAIIVLEHGSIIERGDHEALLENKGRYYQLYTGKAELD